MNLKDRFWDVEADCRDCQHDKLLRILVALSATDSKALARPLGGAVHSIRSGHVADLTNVRLSSFRSSRYLGPGKSVSGCVNAERTDVSPASY